MGLYGLSTRLAQVSTMQCDSTVSTVLCYIVHSVQCLLILIIIMSAWEIIIAQVYVYHGHLPVSTNYQCIYQKDKCPCSKNIFPYCAKCTKELPDITRNDPSAGGFRPVFSYSLEVTLCNIPILTFCGFESIIESSKGKGNERYEKHKLKSKARTACARRVL